MRETKCRNRDECKKRVWAQCRARIRPGKEREREDGGVLGVGSPTTVIFPVEQVAKIHISLKSDKKEIASHVLPLFLIIQKRHCNLFIIDPQSHYDPEYPDCSSGPLARLFTRSLALLTQFTYSLARRTLIDSMAIFSVCFSILDHSASHIQSPSSQHSQVERNLAIHH